MKLSPHTAGRIGPPSAMNGSSNDCRRKKPMRLQARLPVSGSVSGEDSPFTTSLPPQHHAHIHRRPGGKAVYHLCEHHPGYAVLRQADDVLDKMGEGGSARCSSRTIEQDDGASNADFRKRRKAGCISLYKKRPIQFRRRVGSILSE